MIARHKFLKHGLIVEIKSERSERFLEEEGDKLREQLERYVDARYDWPTHTQGATENLETVDVLFISHADNARSFLNQIQKSERLEDALKENLVLLIWELVRTTKGGERLRIRYHKGKCHEESIVAYFSDLNGYESEMPNLAIIQETNSVRMKMSDIEPLLVLMARKALSLPENVTSFPTGLVEAQRPAYLQGEEVFFQESALLALLNSTNDLDRRKYSAQISRRMFVQALELLVKLEVFHKEANGPYYRVSTTIREHHVDEWVLRKYAKLVIETRKPSETRLPTHSDQQRLQQ